jgi:hypothetical protein
MRLERLRRVRVLLLIDSLMTRGATIDSGNSLERLIVVKVAQNDLIDAFRRIQKVEHRSISEGNDNGAGIQSVQPVCSLL